MVPFNIAYLQAQNLGTGTNLFLYAIDLVRRRHLKLVAASFLVPVWNKSEVGMIRVWNNTADFSPEEGY